MEAAAQKCRKKFLTGFVMYFGSNFSFLTILLLLMLKGTNIPLLKGLEETGLATHNGKIKQAIQVLTVL